MTTCANCDGSGCWACRPIASPPVTMFDRLVTANLDSYRYEEVAQEIAAVHKVLTAAGVPELPGPGRLPARITYLLRLMELAGHGG